MNSHRLERRSMRFWVGMVALSVGIAMIMPWAGVVGVASRIASTGFPNEGLAPVDVLARMEDSTQGDNQVLAESFTDQVQFDNYSLSLRGQRIFLYSGEFHTFRLPVPDLWPDILEKFKAAGMNGVSVYTHMGLINPSSGVVDFDGFRALQPLYDAAKAAGIWVVLRPGPYINAETTAGGIAHWITSEIAGNLRTNDSDWRASWQAYIQGIIDQTAPNQITEGGPVIAVQVDNEYNQAAGGPYFADLEAVYRDSSSGIVVPLTYNDPGEGRNFINGTGAVDLYGLDSYPQGFDCSNPTRWSPVPSNWHQYHESANPSQAWYFPEFQGGSFDAWGPTSPGYDQCRILTGPEFQSVFYHQLWASNAKLISYYMTYGGTSWGGIPFPGVYTSYDYGSPITESRMLTSKFSELKFQAIFLRSSPEFHKTDWIGDTSTGLSGGSVSNTAAFVTLLRNPDTGAGFWIVRQNNSTSTNTTNFSLDVTTANGTKLTIPQVASSITLSGRQSKHIVTDYAFGANSRALYSTAQVYFAGVIDGRDVLFLYGDSDQEHEASITFTGTPNSVQSTSGVQVTNNTIVSFISGINGLITVYDSDTQLVLFADSETAKTFFNPVINGEGDFGSFWGIGTNDSVLVGGPYLVRTAEIDGSQLNLRGDLNTSDTNGVMLTVIAPKSVTSVTWNGEQVSLSQFNSTFLTGSITSPVQTFSIPELGSWRFQDSLPEIQTDFDDSSWAVANHTTTNIPIKPAYGDGRVLYGCDYGFCENIVLWRGHFNGTGIEQSANLSINGGKAFAASVWLNDVFLNTSFGNSTNNRNSIEETDQVFVFPDGAVVDGEDNVITVVQDNMGLDEDSGDNSEKSPRGIRGFSLNSGNFSEWKVQGKVGGYINFPDKVRGVLNEGGLFGERKGWHLPGFDTSSWESRELSDGLPDGSAGVGFFVTTFNLSIAENNDVMLSFTFGEEFGQPYRAYLFVNGWMLGKRVGNLGPQAKFPVHEGILDYQGSNTVAVALWAMTPNVTVSPQLSLTLDGAFEGGVGKIATNNPVFSSEGRE